MTRDGLSSGLSEMWHSVLSVLPTALAFVAILAVGYVVARLLRGAVRKGLNRAGFDRALERGAFGRALHKAEVSATDLSAKVAFYAVLLFALDLAFGIWGPNPVSTLLTAVIAWLPRLFIAIVLVVVAAAIAGAAHDLIASALAALHYGRLLARAVSVIIITLGVLAALDQVQIATAVTQPLLIAVLATVAGVVIVGVGGGLIRPMQNRWEAWLSRAGAESAAIREHARAYADERRQSRETPTAPPAPTDLAEPGGSAAPARFAERVAHDAASQEAAGAAAGPEEAADQANAQHAEEAHLARAAGSGSDITTVIDSDTADTGIISRNATGEAEKTQVIRPAEAAETQPLPTERDKVSTSAGRRPSR